MDALATGAAVALAGLLAAVLTLPWEPVWTAYWRSAGVLALPWLLPTTLSPETETILRQLSHAALPMRVALVGALFVASVLVTAARRVGWRGLMMTFWSGARALAFALSFLYLAYVLYAAPAQVRDAGIVDRILQQEQTLGR